MKDEITDSKTESFIVKIWVEDTVREHSKLTWRGHITHVVSGERRYVKSLDEIAQVFRTYLNELGVG